MKKTIFFLGLLLLSFFSFAQEFDEQEGTAIPSENNSIEEENPFFERMDVLFSQRHYGPFDVNRYKLEINLIDISYGQNEAAPMMDILSIAQAEERRRRSYIRDIKAPSRQLDQIRAQLQIFGNNSGHTNQNFEYNRNIRNDALLENRQPFSPFTPYYGRFGRPYYLDGYYGTPTYMYYRR